MAEKKVSYRDERDLRIMERILNVLIKIGVYWGTVIVAFLIGFGMGLFA